LRFSLNFLGLRENMSSKSGHCEEDVDSESSRRRGESFQTLRQREERMLVRTQSMSGRRKRMETRMSFGSWLMKSRPSDATTLAVAGGSDSNPDENINFSFLFLFFLIGRRHFKQVLISLI
jgi:hypothetical protein